MKIIGAAYLVALLCCVAFVVEAKPPLGKIRESGCLETMGVTMEDVRNAIHNSDGELDKKIGCFHACFMKYTGLMNEDNTINREHGHEKVDDFKRLPEEARKDLHESIDGCAEEAEKLEDECEIANSFFKCSFAKLPHHHGPPPEE